MHVLPRFWFVVVLVTACGKGERTGAAPGSAAPGAAAPGSAVPGSVEAPGSGAPDARAQCTKVRDHLVELLMTAYIAEPGATFDGLDRADPQISEGLDLAVTRDTFGAFLATQQGKAWVERQKARAISSPEMAATVEKCTQQATQANLDCWLAARNVPAFQLCPPPGPVPAPAP